MARETQTGELHDPNDPQSAPVMEQSDARQAVEVHQVRYMLYIGLAVVIVGFIIAFIWVW